MKQTWPYVSRRPYCAAWNVADRNATRLECMPPHNEAGARNGDDAAAGCRRCSGPTGLFDGPVACRRQRRTVVTPAARPPVICGRWRRDAPVQRQSRIFRVSEVQCHQGKFKAQGIELSRYREPLGWIRPWTLLPFLSMLANICDW